MSAQAEQAGAEQAADRRRRRKERSAKSHAPEPKNIVSGAGQPLDPGVRRELEEQLGHDLSRVRLHTGRDAAQLTRLLGADAVAVGQDVLFAEGTFQPGTDAGRRLLAHELLHTVQNPHGLGTLRAGREPGAVSLPQEAIEREAEGAAQSLVRQEPEQSAPAVQEGQATPGWLRYATVDADRRREEAIDPATLIDRLANSLVRSLRGDPEDLSKRTRNQLTRLPDELLGRVLDRLDARLLGSELDRVLDFVDEIDGYPEAPDEEPAQEAHDAPEIEPDTAGDVRAERDGARRREDEDRADQEKPPGAPGPEKARAGRLGAPGSTPLNGGTHDQLRTASAERTQRERAGSEAREEARKQPPDVRTPPDRAPAAGVRDEPPAASGGQGTQDAPAAAPALEAGAPQGAAAQGSGAGEQAQARESGEQQGGQDQQDGQSGQDGQDGQQDGGGGADEQGVPVPGAAESAAANRPGAAAQSVADRQGGNGDARALDQLTGTPTALPQTPLPAPTGTLDGLRGQDLDGPEDTTDEGLLSDSASEVDVGGEEPSAWDIELGPDDFLPAQDPDVSGVPTADQDGTATVPDFPAPPPTKAEQVQAERDAEDAEDAADGVDAEAGDATADADATAGSDGGTAGQPDSDAPSAPETVGGPGDTLQSGLAPEDRASGLPDPGPATKDPKSGDDPKAGPVAAQTTVQQAPGAQDGGPDGTGAVTQGAAKEEQGSPAAGEQATAAQEKTSPQAVGGTAAAPANIGQGQGAGAQQTGAAPAAGAQAQGGTGTAPAAGAPYAAVPPGPGPTGESPSRTQSTAQPAVDHPATAQTPTGRAAPRTTSGARAAAAAPTSTSAPAPTPQAVQQEPAGPPKPQRATGTAASNAPASPGRTGGVASKPAGQGKKKDSAQPPDLSQVSPEAGLSTAATLRPHQALQAMGGVGGAVDRSVGDEHKKLASAPPSMQRPAGAPQTLEGKPKTDAPAQYSKDPAKKSDAPAQDKAEVTGAKQPEGPIEAEKAEEPGGWQTFKMALGFGIGWIAKKLGFKVDAQELASKFAGLPTKDEALKQAQAGNAPGVQMAGQAQQTSDEQGTAVDTKGRDTVATARDDSGRSMGENQVYPNAPQEQLKAKVPGQDGAKAVAPGAATTGAVPPDAASTVAEHDKGPEFHAAFTQGQKGMSDGRQTKVKGFRDSQQKHRQQVESAVGKNTQDQAGQRAKALDDVGGQRADWRKEQDQELQKLGTKKSDRADKVRKDVADRQKKTDDDVTNHKTDSDKKIKDQGVKAETDAKNKTDGAAQDSGNWLTKAFDWIKQKVLEIKNAIVRIIRDARNAVVGFIKNFKDTVERWINEARKFIVDTVKNLINDLIEFAKAMVLAVIELAARIRKFVTGLIAAAIAFVTKLAAQLKKLVTDLLNTLAKLLNDLLNVLKKMLMDVVKSVIDAVKTVLDYANKLLAGFGEFMMIAIDFLDDPGGWLSGAKNSAVDGAKNHLFSEVKAAVKQWFQQKIQEIIGVPKAIIEKLIKGGFPLEKIVQETWDAVVPQLPFIIGEIVVTKVVAKLIPGAGWVTAVIDAIRTAIGALGQILSALGAVLSWLQAVRQGGAGILFAKAVAAGIVALLELAYQALLDGIGKYVAKVGKRLKGIAAKLGKGVVDGKGKGRHAAGGAEEGGGAPRRERSAEDASAEHPADDRAPTSRPKENGTDTGRPRDTEKDGSASGPNRKPKAGDKDAPGRPKGEEPGTARPKDKAGETSSDKSPHEPDTHPTPPAKAKPKPPQKPKPARDETPNKPKDANDPAKPKDNGKAPSGKDAEPAKPKREGDEGKDSPTKPKGTKDDGRSGKPKDSEDGAPNRHKQDKEGEGPRKQKSDKDEDGKNGKPRKPKEGEHGPRRPKKRADKSGPGRPKSKKDKDKQKEKEDSKEQRLEKILIRLHPNIGTLLGKSVHERVFTAALAGMRAWYRLTSLTKKNSQAFNVVATLNPNGTAGEGYQLSGEEIRPLIRQVTSELLSREEVTDRAREMRRQKHESQTADDHQGIDESLQVNGGRDIPAAVLYLLQRNDRLDVSEPGEDSILADPYEVDWGKMELYDIGEGQERVKEQKKTGLTNMITQGIGKYQHLPSGKPPNSGGKRQRKPEESLKSVGLSGPRFALGLRTYALRGQAPEGFTDAQAELVKNAHWLMFVRESHRNRTNLVYAAMTTDLLSHGPQRGGLTPHQAFAEHQGTRTWGRGSFPMSMKRAAPAAMGLEQEEVLKQTKYLSGTKAEREELKKREGELAEKWLLAKLEIEGGIDFKNREEAEKKALELIRKLLSEFYGLRD